MWKLYELVNFIESIPDEKIDLREDEEEKTTAPDELVP